MKYLSPEIIQSNESWIQFAAEPILQIRSIVKVAISNPSSFSNGGTDTREFPMSRPRPSKSALRYHKAMFFSHCMSGNGFSIQQVISQYKTMPDLPSKISIGFHWRDSGGKDQDRIERKSLDTHSFLFIR